jgi:zinc protease
VFIDRPDAPQSVVMIGRPAGDAADPAATPQDVVNMAVGGSFAARLNNRLREQLGYTYGMFSSFSRGAWGGRWSITSSLKTAATVDGLREALAIVEAARAAPLPDDELAKARQLMTRALPQGFETNGELASTFAQLVARRQPLDWHQGFAARVAAVTPAEAASSASAAWAGASIVVVGDWAAVGGELASLGLPIEHRDADGQPVARP